MSQYFKLVAPSRNEFASLPGAMGVVERITNAKAMTMLAFLLYDHDAPDEYYDYYGRWAGTDARLVGDYDDSGLYDECQPTMDVAPLSNPNRIKVDMETSTAPDPDAVTEDDTIEIGHLRNPVLKGSWNSGRRGHSIPGPDHPDAGTDVGSYVPLRESDSDMLDDDTFGVVMDIENDWTDVTEGVEREMAMLVDDDAIEQDGTTLLPKSVMEA